MGDRRAIDIFKLIDAEGPRVNTTIDDYQMITQGAANQYRDLGFSGQGCISVEPLNKHKQKTIIANNYSTYNNCWCTYMKMFE